MAALLRRTPFGRRRDTPTSPRTSVDAGTGTPLTPLPPPYSPEDPRASPHCQAPPTSFHRVPAPEAPRRASLPWPVRRGSRSISPAPSETDGRRASTPAVALHIPVPPPAALHSAASPPYTPTPGREHLADMGYAGPSVRARARERAASRSPPPRKPASIATLPLGLLHHILSLTLDPAVTPSPDRYIDPELEPCLRLHALFLMRGVSRRFFLAAISILRDRMIPIYISLLPFGASSDPHPPGGDSENPTGRSVFAQRSRETAVLDRFIAVRVGEDLRRAESSLCEDSGAQAGIFSGLQPAARIEDLLLSFPPNLVAPGANARSDHKTFPLPHAHLLVQSTPLWTGLYVSHARVDMPRSGKFWNAPKKTLVVEVRRRPSVEDTVAELKEALEHVRRGWREWGEKVV